MSTALNEVFGIGRRRTSKLTPDQEAELAQQRRGDLRQMGSPSHGKRDVKLAADSLDRPLIQPEDMTWAAYIEWIGNYRRSRFNKVRPGVGPAEGDVVKTEEGAFTVVNASVNGGMVIRMVPKDQNGSPVELSWLSLSKPVLFRNRKYYSA